jgi:glycerate kinase
MKIVIAIDSYKGTLSSLKAANIIKQAITTCINNTWHEIEIFPMADGGEGTLQAIMAFDPNAILYKIIVKDALFRDIQAPFLINNNTKSAVIEMANIAGLPMLKNKERNIMEATTYGVGQAIKKVLDMNVSTVYLGIGGSATNDAGLGMLQALGAKFLNANNNDIRHGARDIGKITKIDLTNFDHRLKNIDFISICDVTNPFYGPDGATYVYGPQKGASKEQIQIVDNHFKNFSYLINHTMNVDIQNIKGAGAGGGMGGGAAVFLNAEMKTGADWLIEFSDIERSLATADLVITGEGKTDIQTLNNKLPVRIGALSQKYHKKTIIISGDKSIHKDDIQQFGIDDIYALTDYFSLEQAIKEPEKTLYEATLHICNEIF